MSKRVKISVCLSFVLCVLICVLPAVKQVEQEYYAVDTFSGEKAVVRVDVAYLNFLILKDKMLGKIQVFDDGEIYTYETDSLFYVGRWRSNNQDGFLHAFSGFYFNPTIYWGKTGEIEGSQTVGFETIHAYISPDFDKVVMYHQEENELHEGQTRQEVGLKEAEIRQYIGSIEKDKELENLEYFKGYIRETPIK